MTIAIRKPRHLVMTRAGSLLQTKEPVADSLQEALEAARRALELGPEVTKAEISICGWKLTLEKQA